MTTNDGGPAFPYEANSETLNWGKGMTLRDYFAAAAIGGSLANPQIIDTLTHLSCVTLAKWAYEVSDAMLAERAK